MLLWLSAWYNAPFLLALLIGLGFIALTFLGMGKDVDGGVDIDGDGLPDIGGHDHDVHHGSEPGHLHLLGFGWLGVGKAPLTILLQTLLLSFGLIGLLMNAMVRDLFASLGSLAFPLSLSAATVGSATITRAVAALFQRFMPPEHATSRKPGELVGRIGTTAALTTRTFGQVTVTEVEKALVNACADVSVPLDIPRGTEVHLVGYDAERRVYRVVPVVIA